MMMCLRRLFSRLKKSRMTVEEMDAEYLRSKVDALRADLEVIGPRESGGRGGGYWNQIEGLLAKIDVLESPREKVTAYTIADSLSYYIIPAEQLDAKMASLRGKFYRLSEPERKEWDSILSRTFPITREREQEARAALHRLSMAIYEAGLRYLRQSESRSTAVTSLTKRVVVVFCVLLAITQIINDVRFEMLLWGALGGALSTLLRFRDVIITPTRVQVVMDQGLIRTVVGAVGGLLMFYLLNAQLIEFPFLKGEIGYSAETYSIMGFIAGFSERIVFGTISVFGRRNHKSAGGGSAQEEGESKAG